MMPLRVVVEVEKKRDFGEGDSLLRSEEKGKK